MILEDNPYGDLRVEGEKLPSIKSFDESGNVIYAGSFSKILSPGLRVAYAIGPDKVLAKMTVGKQASDVHTSVLNQMIVYRWLTQCAPEKHIEKICSIYRKKRDLMTSCIDSELGGFVDYVRPDGGLFVWCRLPENVDMLEFVKKAIDQKVAVVPGNAFLMNDCDKCSYIRLNYSTPSDEKIVEGVKRLGNAAKSYM